MHWISLISILIILNLCQTLPDSSKDLNADYVRTYETFSMETYNSDLLTSSSTVNPEYSGDDNTSDAVPADNVKKSEKEDERDVLTYVINDGTNKHGYFNLLVLINVLTFIMYF